MPTPGEHTTVQARILASAQEIGWTYVPRGEAEKWRGFDSSRGTPAEQAAEASPYLDDVFDAQVFKASARRSRSLGGQEAYWARPSALESSRTAGSEQHLGGGVHLIGGKEKK